MICPLISEQKVDEYKLNSVEHAIFYGEMGKTVSNCSSSQLLPRYLFISSTLNFFDTD